MGIVKKLVWSSGARVMSGPFKGMRFRSDSVCGRTGPKILGTYELELHHLVREIISAKPKLILDIGAAEGYYAVGLARALPQTEVIAFELLPEGRNLLARVASENGVRDQINIQGECSEAVLKTLLTQRQVDYLVMDVEGAESDILTAAIAPLLHKTCLLVEIHDYQSKEIAVKLQSVFENTHRIHDIPAKLRQLSDISNLVPRAIVGSFKLIGRDYLRERPPGMRWFWFVPK